LKTSVTTGKTNASAKTSKAQSALTKTYIVDTSVILDDAANIFALSQEGSNKVVIAETVLDEIDAKKSGFGDINFQAREFNRIMDEAIVLGEDEENKDGHTLRIVYVKVGDSTFDLVSKSSYKTLTSHDAANIINDRKILEIAACYEGSEVVTNDIAMKLRALSMGLKSQPFKTNRIDDIEKLEFVERIDIKVAQKEFIESSSPSDYGLELSHFTNIEFVVEETGEHILAFYKPTGFHIIDEDEIRKLVVKPKNKEQLFFLNMLIDPDVPIVVCAGVTGSGKNLLAMQGAVKSFQEESADEVKYCRNTVTAGDTAAQLGFLKGDESTKLGVFTYPLYDAISGYMRIEMDDRLKRSKAADFMTNEDFLKKYNIEAININQMRGVNLEGYLIFDEWQNSSPAINKLMLTRVVDGSKVVILGDLHQIDHPHLTKYNNALAIMLKKAKTSNMIAAVKLSKVVRGKIAEFAENEL
jgi:PhoH-like ATPase